MKRGGRGNGLDMISLRWILRSMHSSRHTAPSTLRPQLTSHFLQGISLTMEQFNTLVTLLPQIETALAEKGEDIVRPDYSGEKAAPVAADSEDEDDGGGGGSGGGKKNFEETSEEDEG